MTDARQDQPVAPQGAEDLARAQGLLTERFETLRDLERDQDFLSGACREVELCVGAVIGYIELLAADLKQPSESLTQLHTGMKRLLAVVADLADLVAAGSGQRQLQPQPIDFEDVVEEAAAAVYSEAVRKQQRLVVDIAEEARAIRADPPSLRRLLVLLLAHAVRATPFHGTVTVSASRTDGSGLVGVSDGGPPIEDEDLARLFRPFASFHSDALWGDAAPGPAFALVKQLVEAHGGSIRVERPAYGGNTFFFTIPQ